MNNLETENRFSILDNLKKFFYQDIRNDWLSLKNPQWETIVISGIILGSATSAPDIIPFGDPPTDLKIRAFDGNAIIEQLYASPKIPSNYQEGTDIIFGIEWTPINNNAGNVKWFLDYTWANLNDVFSAQTTISVVDAADGLAWKHQEAHFTAISGTGKKILSTLNFRLSRDPTDAQDTYTSDAGVLNVLIHYKINTFGSRQMDIK